MGRTLETTVRKSWGFLNRDQGAKQPSGKGVSGELQEVYRRGKASQETVAFFTTSTLEREGRDLIITTDRQRREGLTSGQTTNRGRNEPARESHVQLSGSLLPALFNYGTRTSLFIRPFSDIKAHCNPLDK